MWTADVTPHALDTIPLSSGAWRRDIFKSFLQGFLISASNPKVILFYIAFLPTFIDLTVLNRSDMFLVVGLTLVGLMISIGACSERHQPYRRLADGSGRCFSRCERVSRAA